MRLFTPFILLLSLLFFSACAHKKTVPYPKEIKDIKAYEQKADNYLKNVPSIEYYDQIKFDKVFNKKYFQPWHIKKPYASKKQATWGHVYAKRKVYGDNHRPISKKWFKKQIANADFDNYNTILKKAITTKNSALRVFPTNSKIFYNPKKAGEGFPFDYNQNSGIKINSPLLISHYSKDKAWAYVQASFASGWIQINDIAYVDEKIAKKFESGNYYVAIKDNFPIYKNGVFKEYIKVGTIFPKTKSGKYLTIGKDINLNGFLSTVTLNENQIDKKPIKLNQKNVATIFNELISEPYGWGELLNHRDCSALTRDFIAPFGIYLGRNSASQKNQGKYHNLLKLTPEEKKAYIIKHATPYLSLIYLKGHIMLYIGEKNGEPLAFHNIWGIKTLNKNNEQGRFIIGRAVVTTLNPGAELKDLHPQKALIDRIIGVSNLKEKVPSER